MNKALLIKLRNITNAPMNACLSALNDAFWDLDAAIDLIKVRGLQTSTNRSGKIAAEGAVMAWTGSALDKMAKSAAMVEINCNTDFVAKSVEFRHFALEVVMAAFGTTNGGYFTFEEALNKVEVFDAGEPKSLATMQKDLAARTREDIVIRRWWGMEAGGDNRMVQSYVHPNNQLAVLATVEAPSALFLQTPEFQEFAENVAMQIAAMNPLATIREALDAAEIERQTKIFETQIQEMKKVPPPAAQAKILEGKLAKWYSEVVLMEQESVIEPKKTVQQVADEVSIKLCGVAGKVLVHKFIRCQVGEGIAVEKTDFAQDVSKLVGSSNE
jgi:elongation factor Ts